MSASSTKRKRADGADPYSSDQSDGDDNSDSVIGLDVGGQLYYTNKSTLTAGSTYFAARFGGMFSAGSSRKDEFGRRIYFIDADGELFKHVLAFLRRGVASWCHDDRVLVKRLVAEAEYFGVHTMIDELLGRAKIVPDGSNKGILYWLGTMKGEEDHYENPYKLREIVADKNEKKEGRGVIRDFSSFFEHRPSVLMPDEDHDPIETTCDFLRCTTISRKFCFASIAVKPTHYSLRYGGCYGMSDWDLEASVDGESWDLIHKARKERGILKPSQEELDNMGAPSNHHVDIAEKNHRQLWKVDSSPSFYKHFRFLLPTKNDREYFQRTYDMYEPLDDNHDIVQGDDGRILFSNCLHGCGFELYGEVKAAPL